MPRLISITLATLFLATPLFAQQGKTRNQLVLEDQENVGDDDHWIYNDLESAFNQAKAEDKPLLVVFRCIPCEACAQLDESIVERDPGVRDLMDQYVCVRIVHANGMDLGLFQFDYDQSFAAFLMNADKTIYARYGTRSHQTESDQDVSLEGFAEALEAGLKVHAEYPNNKSQLAGKQPQSKPAYPVPEQFPQLAKYTSKLDYQGNVAASCIHCHQVGETLRAELRDRGEPIPTKILFSYPHPKALGLMMDPKKKGTVKKVTADSPADAAGFEAGDELLSIAGQSILSTADIQWALHNAPDSGSMEFVVQRNGQPMNLTMELPPGWRKLDDISWRATSWSLRRMTTGGLKLEEAAAEMRKKLGIDDDSLALIVKHVGQYGDHAHAKRQGFRQGDVIIDVDGSSQPMREADLFALLVNEPVGERVPFTVRRGEQELRINLTMQK